MAKQKVGLHKQAREIFEGVPFPNGADPHEPAKRPVSAQLSFLHPTAQSLSCPIRSMEKPLPTSTQPKQSGIAGAIRTFKRIPQRTFRADTKRPKK